MKKKHIVLLLATLGIFASLLTGCQKNETQQTEVETSKETIEVNDSDVYTQPEESISQNEVSENIEEKGPVNISSDTSVYDINYVILNDDMNIFIMKDQKTGSYLDLCINDDDFADALYSLNGEYEFIPSYGPLSNPDLEKIYNQYLKSENLNIHEDLQDDSQDDLDEVDQDNITNTDDSDEDFSDAENNNSTDAEDISIDDNVNETDPSDIVEDTSEDPVEDESGMSELTDSDIVEDNKYYTLYNLNSVSLVKDGKIIYDNITTADQIYSLAD